MAKTGIMIGGVPSDRVFDDVVDFDATALYPSIIIMCNVDQAGQIGRLMIVDANGEDQDAHLFIEALASGDPVEIGRVWLSLPGIGELVEIVLERD